MATTEISTKELPKPSARKSFGAYKPLIVHPTGRTEIVGQRGYIEHVRQETVFYSGPSTIYHAQRGKTFPTRQDAIDYAAKIIAARAAAYAARQAQR